MRTGNFVKFIVAISLLFAGCRYDRIEDECPHVNEVRAGAKFMVNLPEDHRSGYLWQLSGDYDKKILEQLNSVWHGEARGVDFNFRALFSWSDQNHPL
jgi:hypothetical protein